MTLTIVVIPKKRVRALQVVHAVQTNRKTLTTIRVKRKRTQVLRISHRIQSPRQYSPAAIPMASSILSGIATGEEASFPSSTYLRKRYRKLQRCKVSRHPGSGEEVPKDRSDDLHDPSFDAIRALNGQPDTKPDPVVVPAIINNNDSNGAEKLKSGLFAPGGGLPHRLISDQHAPQSFSARVDRLMEAAYGADGGLHIRFASSDRDGRIGVSARTAISSNTASGSWITEESVVDHENLRRVAGHLPRSPFPPSSLSSGSFPHRDSDIQRIDIESTVRGTGSLLISEDQRQELEDRIRGEIAGSANTDRRDSLETVIHVNRPKDVDPHVVRLQGRDGIEKHNISPIPLDYQRRRGLATPSIDRSETQSYLSSPLGYVLTQQATRAKIPAPSIRSQRSPEAIAGGNSWFPDITFAEEISPRGVKHQRKKGKENQGERREKNSRIIRWVHHVKEAFGYRKDPSTKRSGKAIGVFKDEPSNDADKWAAMPITYPDNTLWDVTNVRQPGYLTNNSFAHERQVRQKTKLAPTVQIGKRPRPRALPVHPPGPSQVKQFELNSSSAGQAAMASARTALRGHVITDSPPLTRNMTWGSSQATTVKPIRTEEELHPNVAFALARLEGRAAPPPLSPIRRWRDDTDAYGAHVEVELGRLRLDAPAPLTPYLYGALTARFEEAVDAGFDCAMEAPLSPGARRYLDSLI